MSYKFVGWRICDDNGLLAVGANPSAHNESNFHNRSGLGTKIYN